MSVMQVFVPGDMVPWSVKWGRGHTYIDPKLKAYKEKVAMFARNAGFKPIKGECRLHLGFVRHGDDTLLTKKPDLTNLIKSTEDALTGIAWKDDCQVTTIIASKHSTPAEKDAGVHVYVDTGL